jgi:hypothetical protein
MPYVPDYLTYIGLVLLPWGIGSLMKTIGVLRGWNPTRTFWFSFILYALLLITILRLFFMSSNFPVFLVWAVIGLGILSPIVNLAIKWMFPKSSIKSTSDQIYGDSKNLASVKKDASLQERPTFNPGNDQQQPQSIKVPFDVKNLSNAEAVTSHIFISYRRSDSADITGRIYDRLIERFGKHPIFKDVDSIPLGLDFKDYLDEQVGKCNVLLAIIGDRWLDASDASGNRRLDDPSDFVKIEIESALQRNIPVIPLLVRGASMPNEENLPPSLRKLSYRNGIPIRPDPDFHRDMDRLIKALEGYVG